ncbi:MAG: T9SS type A sorting domain-containing protein [Bacteroidetes bacterium]|nr:T9SS type A sorting domain-containing protein [Bacteroidota bacterium]
MKKYLIVLCLCFFCRSELYAQQGVSNIWLLGYDSDAGAPPGGISHFDFISGSAVITYDSIGMEFRHTHANISDAQGNLLFYTNGVYIADATNDTMQNGSGINPGAYSNFVPDGHLLPQSALILKKPGSASEYFMFHNTMDSYPSFGSFGYQLYLSIIDMNGNNGLGSVVTKNFPIISDTINTGKLASCRHANGRDWWVICHRANTNMYYKLLITPQGVASISSQNIGAIRQWDSGQAKFSPDGSKFAYYHYFNGLDIMDFDRCTGDFSNCVSDVTLPFHPGNVGCEFSPNSQFLYVSNVFKVYQYDVTSANILASRMDVAVWDSFAQPGIPQLGAYLCLSQLAPDGKIYITTGNSTTYMGRINNPDVAGMACDVAQHSVVLPAYYFNTIPNHPNFFLGKIPGSPCDTITGVGIAEPEDLVMKLFPNPTNGLFTISFPVQQGSGLLQMFDVVGNKVKEEVISPWSQYKQIEITGLPDGIYFCKIKWDEVEGRVKVVKVTK